MAEPELRQIGNDLYERGADGLFYFVRKLAPDAQTSMQPAPQVGLLDIGSNVPERLSLVNDLLNPIAALPDAMDASQRMFAPDATGMERVAAGGDMLSGMAGVLAPVAGAVRAGTSGARALMEGLLGGSPTTQAAGDVARNFAADEYGGVSLPFTSSLPAPRNEAEAIAKEILELRATGNVDAVTERMMDAADPQYMYDYTPLPMDAASRMARAGEIGFGKDRFHGNNMDFTGFMGNVFTSDNPTVSSTYNRGMLDAQIYPVVTREGPMGSVTVEGSGSNWNQLSPEMIDDLAVARGGALYPHEVTGKLSTRGIERAAQFEGRSGVTFKDINDLGPGFNSQQFKGLGYTPEQEAAMRQQYLTELSKPSEIDVRLSPNLVRSRFARFDPMFSHLRNLSAGIIPIGLLSMPRDEEQY